MSSTSSDTDSYDSESCESWNGEEEDTTSIESMIGSDEDSDPDAIHYPYRATLRTKVTESIPTAVADLKEIAGLNVAIMLWKHVNIPQVLKKISKGKAKNSNIELTVYNKVLKSTEDLPTPESITEVIIAYVDKIRKQIKDWVSYNFRRVFFDHTNDRRLYNHIYHMVFYSNGTINHRDTARNLFMNSLRLNEVEKYYLLCTYCLKDDLECFSPALPTSIKFKVHQCTFDDHPLIYYWNCFFRNEMDKITIPAAESIDTFMVKHRRVDNWPAKKYFFNRLDFDEQVRMAVWLIDKRNMKYMFPLMTRLDNHQRSQVIALRGLKIISMLICTRAHFEEALTMWFEIRDIINKHEFLMIFKLSLNAKCSGDFLKTIWTTACVEFKNHILDVSLSNEHIISKMLNRWISHPDNDAFFCIMQHANEDFKTNITKKRFFIEACEELISDSPKDDRIRRFERLLKSCFTDAKKRNKFKYELITGECY